MQAKEFSNSHNIYFRQQMKLNLLPLLTEAIAFTLITAPTIVQAQSRNQMQRNLAEVEVS